MWAICHVAVSLAFRLLREDKEGQGRPGSTGVGRCREPSAWARADAAGFLARDILTASI